jgi:hypothetical protein
MPALLNLDFSRLRVYALVAQLVYAEAAFTGRASVRYGVSEWRNQTREKS